MTRNRRRGGFTLLEVLGVMFGLGVCMVVGIGLTVTTFRVEESGAATANRLAWWGELAAQFRSDVAAAESAPAELAGYRAGPACLVLQKPGGGAVVYTWEGGVLERVERQAGRELRRPLKVGPPEVSVGFERPEGRSRLVTLRLSDATRRGAARRTDIVAALGGDLR